MLYLVVHICYEIMDRCRNYSNAFLFVIPSEPLLYHQYNKNYVRGSTKRRIRNMVIPDEQ